MWSPTAAFPTEFFCSDSHISHNNTMQNQLRPAPKRRPQLWSGWLEGDPLGWPPLRGATLLSVL